mgnify:CR=1 FL=1
MQTTTTTVKVVKLTENLDLNMLASVTRSVQNLANDIKSGVVTDRQVQQSVQSIADYLGTLTTTEESSSVVTTPIVIED